MDAYCFHPQFSDSPTTFSSCVNISLDIRAYQNDICSYRLEALEKCLTGINLTVNLYQGHMIENIFFSGTSISPDFLSMDYRSTKFVNTFLTSKYWEINRAIID